MVLLGLSEVRNYFSEHTYSSLFIGTTHRTDVFHANMDITFPNMPCDVIGLNYRDQLENAVNDYYGELHKHRLDRDGNDLGIESWYEKTMSRDEVYKRALQEFRDGQGCRFEGYVEMNRVPGFFYITTADFNDMLYQIEKEGYYADLSFTINHFSFGKLADF